MNDGTDVVSWHRRYVTKRYYQLPNVREKEEIFRGDVVLVYNAGEVSLKA